MSKTVVLLSIFVETVIVSFLRILWWICLKEQHFIWNRNLLEHSLYCHFW